MTSAPWRITTWQLPSSSLMRSSTPPSLELLQRQACSYELKKVLRRDIIELVLATDMHFNLLGLFTAKLLSSMSVSDHPVSNSKRRPSIRLHPAHGNVVSRSQRYFSLQKGRGSGFKTLMSTTSSANVSTRPQAPCEASTMHIDVSMMSSQQTGSNTKSAETVPLNVPLNIVGADSPSSAVSDPEGSTNPIRRRGRASRERVPVTSDMSRGKSVALGGGPCCTSLVALRPDAFVMESEALQSFHLDPKPRAGKDRTPSKFKSTTQADSVLAAAKLVVSEM
ncbi:hypothetical protein CEUSTIGMA_g4634.t1 [Chlamydomonas eustigma]|uniref:Uncharacterized protein n=1 Tax=Chlamydomonas eustigma TaxID=1157962 RepID=A0A250X292_9CHLO|nr:hypothetical protein CEUSTIGMA_g4634.t1 [Chlamydomonas eustigma]|eukprot:GAX77188.1 hypothetical protein CEUSTIGMA_g4634.t1 [Chlamydomonas eustigma]